MNEIINLLSKEQKKEIGEKLYNRCKELLDDKEFIRELLFNNFQSHVDDINDYFEDFCYENNDVVSECVISFVEKNIDDFKDHIYKTFKKFLNEVDFAYEFLSSDIKDKIIEKVLNMIK